MEEQKPIFNIIDEICKEKNIEQKMLSFDWIRELKKDNKIHHIIRYQFDLNSANAYHIANDKYATYTVLKENNIPMIEHVMLFSPNTRSAYYDENYIQKVKQMLIETDNKLIIKANDSCQGRDVYCVNNEKSAKKVIEKMFKENKDSISLCPYVDIDFEYRVVVLDGEVLYLYKKRKPFVVGNGKNTIRELIDEKYSKDIEFTFVKTLNFDYIPFENEEIIISWKHNLSGGAEPVVVDENEENIDKIKNIAINAAKAIGIKFATVDIACTTQKELTVVEINGSVCMNKFAELIPDGYNIAKNIYSKAIDKMFEI